MINNITDSNQSFLTKIQVLYDVEKQLEKALPKLEKSVRDPELKEGFSTHLEETRGHIQRLEEIFGVLGEKPKKLASDAIKGIIKDGDWVMKAKAPENIKDAMIAGAARYAEHYEMAGYMTAIIEADALGLTNVSELLSQTLEEEELADNKLEEAVKKHSI